MRTEVFTIEPEEALEAAYELEEIYSFHLMQAIVRGRPFDIGIWALRLSWAQETIVYLEERIQK